jgi:hypothetical protein
LTPDLIQGKAFLLANVDTVVNTQGTVFNVIDGINHFHVTLITVIDSIGAHADAQPDWRVIPETTFGASAVLRKVLVVNII